MGQNRYEYADPGKLMVVKDWQKPARSTPSTRKNVAREIVLSIQRDTKLHGEWVHVARFPGVNQAQPAKYRFRKEYDDLEWDVAEHPEGGVQLLAKYK